MKSWSNEALKTWRGRPMTSIVDWANPRADGSLPPMTDPTFRDALIHFLEVMPRFTTDSENRQLLNVGQLRIREHILRALTEGAAGGKVRVEVEDEHHKFLTAWLPKFAPTVFDTDAVAVMDHFENAE